MNMSERHKTELKKLVAQEQLAAREKIDAEIQAIRDKTKPKPSPATLRLLATTVKMVGKLRRTLWRQGFTIVWDNEDSHPWSGEKIRGHVTAKVGVMDTAIEKRVKARIEPLQKKLVALDTLVAATEKQLVLSGVFDELVTIFKAFEASLAKLSARPPQQRKRR